MPTDALATPAQGREPHVPTADLSTVLAVLLEVKALLANQSPTWLDSREAAEHSRTSLKTLLRADQAGADVGIRRTGRKLVVHRPTLDAWLLAQRDGETSDCEVMANAN